MDREKKAGELFLEGRNCSQAVFAMQRGTAKAMR